MMRIRNIMFAIAAALGCGAYAAVPAGYYNKCEGKGGKELIEALQETLEAGSGDVGYGGLWTLYLQSDVRADGTIWDMYSNVNWIPQTDQCGTYQGVGDCYNREHTVPQSKFHEQSPMKSDAHHIFPTDGKVNGIRSNYPHGECANGSNVPSPGLGRLGKCTYPGYAGTVFEPVDEYKGDFARAYFYMAARYNHLIDDWDYEMFNHTTYPAFSSWAMSMLMKWHKQDPVSQKEIDRNEAIYASKQHNRNPFVDYPDMADYIWGDKTAGEWYSQGQPDAEIVMPADGSEISFEPLTIGHVSQQAITVKCKNLSEALALTLSGADASDFSLSASEVSIADACSSAGKDVTITWQPVASGNRHATLTLSSGDAKAELQLKGTAYDGIVAYDAKDVTETSFVASWTYVGDADSNGCYSLRYWLADDANGSQAEAKAVSAQACQALVEGLDPATAYCYQISTQSQKSNIVSFTTSTPMPSIQLVHQGEIYIEAKPGEASEPLEIDVEAENIDGEIAIKVSAPFLVGTDKLSYGLSTTLADGEDRFYLIVKSDEEGEFSTTITASWSDYVNDETTATARVSSGQGVFEDFESSAEGCDTYLGCTYHGRNADWILSDAGIWAADASSAHGGVQSVRMGKTSASKIEMAADKAHGIGTVSLWACMWTQREAAFVVETSADGGKSWTQIGEGTVDALDYQQFVFEAAKEGNQRLRVRQTAGARFMIDDIDISGYSGSGISSAEAAAWDAYCRHGKLVIECRQPMPAKVYGMDGIARFNGEARAGSTALDLPKGLYIVAVAGKAKRVVVK